LGGRRMSENQCSDLIRAEALPEILNLSIWYPKRYILHGIS